MAVIPQLPNVATPNTGLSWTPDYAAINVINPMVTRANQVGQQWLALSTYKSSTGLVIDPTGTTDSQAAVQAAFNQAAAAGQTVLWDCPVYLQCGATYSKTTFVPPGLSCVFTPAGVAITDSIGFPPFCAMNSSNWTFENFTLSYIASPTLGAFGDQSETTVNNASEAWNNTTATQYLAANAGCTFSGNTAIWPGITNILAMFLISGPCNNWSFIGATTLSVPPGVNASHFIYTAFGYCVNWNNGTAVGSSTPHTSSNSAFPSFGYIQSLTIDGHCMGHAGGLNYVVIEFYRSIRYSDFQTTAGLNVGTTGVPSGSTAWSEPLAPPHAWYVDSAGSPSYVSTDLHILNFVDEGVYVGTTVRRAQSSGFITSLKFEPSSHMSVYCTKNLRPDGFMQMITFGYNYGTVKCDLSIFDSTTLITGGQTYAVHTISFPSGFPMGSVNIEITSIDVASSAAGFSLQNDAEQGHQNVNIIANCTIASFPASAGAAGFAMMGSYNTVKGRYTFLQFTGSPSPANAVIDVTATTSQCDYDITVFGWPAITSSNIFSAAPYASVVGTAFTTVFNNTILVRDINNQYEYRGNGLTGKITWSQYQVVTPSGTTSYTTGITIPGGMAVEQASVYAGSGPALSLGWSGATNNLVSNQGNGRGYIPLPAPVSAGGTNRTLIVTGASNFTGTNIAIGVKASTTTIAT